MAVVAVLNYRKIAEGTIPKKCKATASAMMRQPWVVTATLIVSFSIILLGKGLTQTMVPSAREGTGMGWYASSSPGAGSGAGVNIRDGVGAGSCPRPSGLWHTGVSSRSGAFRPAKVHCYPVPPVSLPVAHPVHHVPREVDAQAARKDLPAWWMSGVGASAFWLRPACGPHVLLSVRTSRGFFGGSQDCGTPCLRVAGYSGLTDRRSPPG